MADKPGENQAVAMSRSTLTAAKETRKRAELDAQLLANRIALLKQEEEKALKKIEDTKKRANEIMHLRDANENKFQHKEQYYKQKWEGIRQAQVRNGYRRDQSRLARESNMNGLLDKKRHQVSDMKMESQNNLLSKKARETHDRDVNADRTNCIRQQKENAKRHLEMDRLKKLEQNRHEYELRVQREEMLRQKTENLVVTMEKEEMELIQRLQNTQALQRSAYEELEAALGGSQASRHSKQIEKQEAIQNVPKQRPAA